MQFLYDQLEDLVTNVFYRDLCDKENRLVCFFITPRNEFNFFYYYPHVFLLDIIYKINRFNIPLLNIYGSTLIKKTFSIISIFFKGKKI